MLPRTCSLVLSRPHMMGAGVGLGGVDKIQGEDLKEAKKVTGS